SAARPRQRNANTFAPAGRAIAGHAQSSDLALLRNRSTCSPYGGKDTSTRPASPRVRVATLRQRCPYAATGLPRRRGGGVSVQRIRKAICAATSCRSRLLRSRRLRFEQGARLHLRRPPVPVDKSGAPGALAEVLLVSRHKTPTARGFVRRVLPIDAAYDFACEIQGSLVQPRRT